MDGVIPSEVYGAYCKSIDKIAQLRPKNLQVLSELVAVCLKLAAYKRDACY